MKYSLEKIITNMDKYKSSGNLILIPKLEDYILYKIYVSNFNKNT